MAACKLIIVKALASLLLLVLIGDAVAELTGCWRCYEVEGDWYKTDVWDRCNCYLKHWEAWQSCNKTCGGGSQKRIRYANYVENVTTNCKKPGDNSWYYCIIDGTGLGKDYRSCNTECYNGGTYHDYNSRYGGGYCECPEGFKTDKGTCCEQREDVAEGGVAAAAHGEEEDDGAGGIAGGAIAGVAILAMAGATIWYFGIRRYKKKKREAEQAAAGEAVQA